MKSISDISASQQANRGRDHHYDGISDTKRERHHADDVKYKIRVYATRSSANRKRQSALGMEWMHIFHICVYIYLYMYIYIYINQSWKLFTFEISYV